MEIGSKEWQQLIINESEPFDIHIDRSATQKFAVYAAELMKWNRKTNLTAITNPKDVAVKHFLDSIIPSRHIAAGSRVLDIGSGGGFPGIPLKILMPELSVTLIEASRKKVSFLKHAIRTLKLENIEACQSRAEIYARQPAACNSFDIIISRALGSIETIITLAAPLLAEKGIIIAMKGAEVFKEISPAYSCENRTAFYLNVNNVKYCLRSEKYVLPNQKSHRLLVIITPGDCYENN